MALLLQFHASHLGMKNPILRKKVMYKASNAAYLRQTKTKLSLVLLQLLFFLLIQTVVAHLYRVLQYDVSSTVSILL